MNVLVFFVLCLVRLRPVGLRYAQLLFALEYPFYFFVVLCSLFDTLSSALLRYAMLGLALKNFLVFFIFVVDYALLCSAPLRSAQQCFARLRKYFQLFLTFTLLGWVPFRSAQLHFAALRKCFLLF